MFLVLLGYKYPSGMLQYCEVFSLGKMKMGRYS